MRSRSVAAAVLVAFATATVPSASFAQATDDPTVKAARARFNEGVEFFDKGQYENARAAFLQAYALRKHPAVLINLAQSSLRSGHPLEAAHFFQQYLKESTGLTAAQRSDAEKGLTEARTKLGRLDIYAPQGAEVYVDGDHTGTAPVSEPVDVEPGSHTVKVNAEQKSVTVAVGQTLPVRFTGGGGAIAPVPVPVPPVPVPAPSTPPAPEEQPPPPAPGTTPPSEQATAQTTTPSKSFLPKSMAPFWLGIGVGVAGGVTAGIFAVFKGQANSNYQSLQAQIIKAAGGQTTGVCVHPTMRFQQACSSLQDDINQVNADATAANVAVGVAIAGVAFGVGWLLFAPKRDAETSQPADSAPPPPATPPTTSFAPVLYPFKGLALTRTF